MFAHEGRTAPIARLRNQSNTTVQSCACAAGTITPHIFICGDRSPGMGGYCARGSGSIVSSGLVISSVFMWCGVDSHENNDSCFEKVLKGDLEEHEHSKDC